MNNKLVWLATKSLFFFLILHDKLCFVIKDDRNREKEQWQTMNSALWKADYHW